MSAPAVSVVVPNHNYGRYVIGCVEAILAQTLRALELIVIDDASDDDSWPRLQRFAHDPRVVLVRHERNAGHHATYDEGIRLARGRYVAIVSADDVAVDRDALRRQSSILDVDPSLGVVFGDRLLIGPDGGRLGVQRVRIPRRLAPDAAFRRLIRGNFIMHSGALVRAACYGELGTFDERYGVGEDWDFWLRLATRYGVAHVPRVLYAYRVHPESLHERIGPEREMSTLHAIIDAAIARAELPSARARRLALVAHADLLLVRARVYAARGRGREAYRDVRDACRRDHTSVLRAGVGTMALHLLLRRVLGPRRDAFVRALRRLLGVG